MRSRGKCSARTDSLVVISVAESSWYVDTAARKTTVTSVRKRWRRGRGQGRRGRETHRKEMWGRAAGWTREGEENSRQHWVGEKEPRPVTRVSGVAWRCVFWPGSGQGERGAQEEQEQDQRRTRPRRIRPTAFPCLSTAQGKNETTKNKEVVGS